MDRWDTSTDEPDDAATAPPDGSSGQAGTSGETDPAADAADQQNRPPDAEHPPPKPRSGDGWVPV